MEKLSSIQAKLDRFFGVGELPPDPSFSHLLPQVYKNEGIDWRKIFIPEFCELFNGLMLRGHDTVQTVFCGVLPTPEVLEELIDRALPGDLFFTHHPIDFEMGSPHQPEGRGPLPIPKHLLNQMVEKGLSFYACHLPLDIHEEISTSIAMIKALDGTHLAGLYPYEGYYFGSLCSISPTNTQSLMEKLRLIFDVPYVEFLGTAHERIVQLAVIPGAADKVEVIQEAEAAGAQALVSGEVISHRKDAYGRAKRERVAAYLPETNLSLIGVSHAASEHLVMETHMLPWFETNCEVNTKTIPMPEWWR